MSKVKAIELVDKFRNEIMSFLSDKQKDENAKKCAIIACEEVLILITAIDGTEYWQSYYEQTIEEIKKL
jgi:hypothetical protein